MRKKRHLFIEEYLKCWNASEAARRAGYSERSAGCQGHRMLESPEVQEAIQQRLDELAMSTNEVLARLTEQARADIGQFVKLVDGQLIVDIPPDKTHLIKAIYYQSGKIKVELHDVQNALQLVGKARAMFTDVTEQQGEVVIRVLRDDD